jgi:hypothetical protein
VPQHSVDDLRQQLRNLGYLSRGVERWFEADPFRSRTFWSELALIAAKVAAILAVLLAAPLTAVTLHRNANSDALSAGILAVLYIAVAFVVLFVATATAALLLRLRPAAAVENPRVVTIASAGWATLIVLALTAWWSGFEGAPSRGELITGALLLLFFLIAATYTLAAALLSLSIHATGRIPTTRRRSQAAAMLGAAAIVAIIVATPQFLRREQSAQQPQQIVTSQRQGKLALVAVDGLTFEIAQSRRELATEFAMMSSVAPGEDVPPPERWASIGTGTPASVHAVHSVEGVRIRGSRTVMQNISRFDFALRDLASAVGVATREALPPTARDRDYIWEVFASRGIAVEAVNWWASDQRDEPLLSSVSQQFVFADAGRSGAKSGAALALAIDAAAIHQLQRSAKHPYGFITIYLPALDVVLNRLGMNSAAALAPSVRALDQLTAAIAEHRREEFDVILVGTPGKGQEGSALIASTIALSGKPQLADIAPTICDFYGFPATSEMPGRSLLPRSEQARIPSFGRRTPPAAAMPPSSEYYENLKSLGYVQ